METLPKKSVLAAVGASLILNGCAANSDRYPPLSMREFERVEGTFTVATPSAESIRPTPAPVEQVQQVGLALADAGLNHQKFMADASSASEAVEAARGQPLGNNEWSIALIALAELDSLRSATAITLGDLDKLYASATLSFTERDEVDEARKQVAGMIATEDAILEELALGLEPVPTPE